MTVFTLLLAIAADFRAHDLAKGAADFFQLLQLVMGFNPAPPTPAPNPPIAPKFTAMSAAACNSCADEIEAFVTAHQPKGLTAWGDGTFLKALGELLVKLLPLFIHV